MPEGSKKTRRESFLEGGEGSPQLVMPDIDENGSHYLISLWHEAGTVNNSGQGITELSWSEIVRWANQFYSTSTMVYVPAGDDQFIPITTKECSLSSWELLTIKELSAAYAAEYSQASDKSRPAPYTQVISEEIDREALAIKFKNILRTFKKDSQEPRYEVEG